MSSNGAPGPGERLGWEDPRSALISLPSCGLQGQPESGCMLFWGLWPFCRKTEVCTPLQPLRRRDSTAKWEPPDNDKLDFWVGVQGEVGPGAAQGFPKGNMFWGVQGIVTHPMATVTHS